MPNIASWFVPPDVQQILDTLNDSVRQLVTPVLGDEVEIATYILLDDREKKGRIYEPVTDGTPVTMTVKCQGKVFSGRTFWGVVHRYGDSPPAFLSQVMAEQILSTFKESTSS